MLTAEDMQAHDRLLGELPSLGLADVTEAYRRARRLYETRRWAGEDADEPKVRSEILARDLADRFAFDPEPLADALATDQEGQRE